MYQSITPNLMTENVEETVKFYNESLGFATVATVPNQSTGKLQFAILAKDNLTLMFQERTSMVGEYQALATEKTKPCCTIYVKVDNVEALAKELSAKTKIIKDLHKTFYGATEFAILDNNGYVLTFAQDVCIKAK